MQVSRTSPDIRLQPQAVVRRTTIGDEATPLLEIDGLIANPDALIDWACTATFAPAGTPEGGYPGIRAAAPLDYVATLCRAVAPLIERDFATGPVRLVGAECSLSLVTQPPDQLTAQQRAPHVDCADPWQFAILHFLCDPALGGTSFYRHRATGFEQITADRDAHYREVRRIETERAGVPSGYIDGDDRHFIRTLTADAAFNRLLVYRSNVLHSGRIARPDRLTANPATGRLTANIFLRLAPK